MIEALRPSFSLRVNRGASRGSDTLQTFRGGADVKHAIRVNAETTRYKNSGGGGEDETREYILQIMASSIRSLSPCCCLTRSSGK